MKNVWELELDKTYLVDDCDRIFESEYDYCEFIENDYEGIKDGLGEWLNQMCEENLEEFTGAELIKKRIKELEEYIEYLENKKEA